MVKIALIDDHEMMLNSLAKAMQEQANLEIVSSLSSIPLFDLLLFDVLVSDFS